MCPINHTKNVCSIRFEVFMKKDFLTPLTSASTHCSGQADPNAAGIIAQMWKSEGMWNCSVLKVWNFYLMRASYFQLFSSRHQKTFRHPISDEVISHRIFKASCCSTPTPFVKTKLDERKPSSDNFPQLSPGEDVTSTWWAVEEWCWMFPNRGFIFCTTVSTLYSASRIMYSVHIAVILKSSSKVYFIFDKHQVLWQWETYSSINHRKIKFRFWENAPKSISAP